MITITSFRSSSKSVIKVHLGILISLGLTLKLIYGSSIPQSDASNSFEFRSLSGEPNYKSVNLTWEIEVDRDLNESPTEKFPKLFTVFYCEIQSFGPHRCKSKLLEDNTIEEQDESTLKHYSTIIDNLRMSTKYSFHIKPQTRPGIQKVSGRSESRDNELEAESRASDQTIIIPTKGFSAQATKCLPTASEIEVETGPYFAGKIVVDGSDCGIRGDPKDPREKYIMRIDHEKCGSHVKPETNTVETFITVQENLGIFTHSTRKFVVVCTFQSGIQTVRASFSVPGKGGVTSMDTDFSNSRNGRERQFRMVDKSALVLREPDSEESQDEKVPQSVKKDPENIEQESKKPRDKKPLKNTESFSGNVQNVNFARLVGEGSSSDTIGAIHETPDTSYVGIIIAVSLSVTMVGAFVFIIQREYRRQKLASNRTTKS